MKKAVLGTLLAVTVTLSFSPVSHATDDDVVEWSCENPDFEEDEEDDEEDYEEWEEDDEECSDDDYEDWEDCEEEEDDEEDEEDSEDAVEDSGEEVEGIENEFPTGGLINKPEIKCIGEVVEEHSENDEISAANETENTIMNNLPTTNETGLESQNIANNDYVEDSPLTVTVYTDTTGIEYLVFEHNGAMAVVRREK